MAAGFRRGRTDADPRAGEWIRFEEDFHFGSAWPGDQNSVADLVYLAAAGGQPFLLAGSAAHVLDRRGLPVATPGSGSGTSTPTRCAPTP